MKGIAAGLLVGFALSAAFAWTCLRSERALPAAAEQAIQTLRTRLDAQERELSELRGELRNAQREARDAHAAPGSVNEEERLRTQLRSRIETPKEGGPAAPQDAERERIRQTVSEVLREELTGKGSVAIEVWQRRAEERNVERLEDLARRLGLTDYQKEQVKTIWDEQSRKRREAFETAWLPRGEPGASRPNLFERMEQIRKDEDETVRRVLSASQYEEYVKYREENPPWRVYGRW